MTKKLAAFRLELEMIEGMERVKARTGAPIAEQVRRAIEAWLAEHDVKAKADRKRASTRRRS
jgi:predicted DNA-binding protein